MLSSLGSSSRIDHYIVTSTLSDNLLECSIIDNLLFSDHVPLKIRLDLTVENVSIKEVTYCSRVAWNKASSESIDRYRDDVELKLSRIAYDKDTRQCKDTSCTCKGHVDKLGVFYRQILNTCTEASQFISTTAPVSESRPPKGGRVIPGWSQEVTNLKQHALFWHRQWISRGRPIVNTLPAKDGDLCLSASNACLPKTEISVFVTECVFFTSTCYKLHMFTLHDVAYS